MIACDFFKDEEVVFEGKLLLLSLVCVDPVDDDFSWKNKARALTLMFEDFL